MKKVLIFLLILFIAGINLISSPPQKPIRILVVTGGHDYDVEHFNSMLAALGPDISYQVAELPAAFSMFLPENRSKYDAIVFYHMWQTISEDQANSLSDCIKKGKPLVVLHHSICAFDDWPEYINIIGGKYFHKPTVVNGKEYPACTYIHDLHFTIKIVDPEHPVTKGLSDIDIFDETYKGYYVADDVTPLLTTDESSSTPVVAWTKNYGKAKVVTIQSGHDTPTFENRAYRKLLRQAIKWVYEGSSTAGN